MCYAWFGIHVIGTIICFMLLIWVTKRNVTDYRSAIILAMACCLVALVSRCLYIMSDNMDTLLVLSKMEYMGKCFVNYCVLKFVIKWKKAEFPEGLLNIFLGINLCAFILIMTCQYHHLYYKSIGIAPSALSVGGYILVKENAFFYYLYMIFIVAELVLSVEIILRPIILGKADVKERKIDIFILMAAFALCIFIVLRMVGVFAEDDPTTLGILVTCIFWTIAINSGSLFDTVKSAKEGLVEDLSEGIIVADNNNSILYSNPAAKRIVKGLENGWSLEEAKRVLNDYKYDGMQIEIDGRYYETRLSEIKDNGSHVKGNMMSIIDVTNVVEQTKQMQELKERAEDANMAKSIFLSNMSHEIRTPMNAIVGMTEILLREDLNDKEKEYLINIKNSGKSLLTIINDVLDFSKIESGKMDIIPENYNTSVFLNDLGMVFLNRIGNKGVDLVLDIDSRMPAVLYGDSARIRQVIINIVNNAIKFTDVGYVRLKIDIVDMDDKEARIRYSVKDTGIGIRDADVSKLFRSFEQINTKRASKQEGTGLGLSVSQRLVELMGGNIEVVSTFGVGSEFYFELKQGIVNKKPAAEIKKRSDGRVPVVTCFVNSSYRRMNFEKMAGDFEMPYISYDEMVKKSKKADYIFVDNELYADMTSDLSAEVLNEATICVLYNPMFETKKIAGTKSVNRPVFSVNFAQTINNETTEVEIEDENCLNFIAPAANILLVDDNEMNRKVAIGLLKPLLMRIDTAVDGKEALDMIKKNKYDLVLMDHMMPVMDGIEATKALRAMDDDYYRKLPVIALTANAVMDARKSFEEAGMDGFVAKPIELNDIVALLRKFIPPEKMYRQSDDIDTMEKAETIEDIPVIDGIDIKEGIKNSGSKEMFLKMLSDYYNIIDIKTSKIEQYLADNMIRDYVIEVHGLKSSSRLIGASKMSNEFLRMEMLGNNNDIEQLKKETPAVLKMFYSFKDKLKSFVDYNDDDKNDVSIDSLINILQDISYAIDNFDLEKADDAMGMLNSCRIPDECREDMELLRAYMSDVEMEEIISMCDKMTGQLKKIIKNI